MIALGLALTLVAAGATAFSVIASASSSTAIPLTALGVTISASPLDLFIAGAASVVLLILGFALIKRGTRRTARTHKELKALRKDKAIAATRTAVGDEEHDTDSSTDSAATKRAAGSARDAADDDTGKDTPGAATNTADASDEATEPPLAQHRDADQHPAV